jgi:hypothetical protein
MNGSAFADIDDISNAGQLKVFFCSSEQLDGTETYLDAILFKMLLLTKDRHLMAHLSIPGGFSSPVVSIHSELLKRSASRLWPRTQA